MGICIISYDRIIPKDSFRHDEADFMYAVSKGIYANYIDENAISFFTFLTQGIQQGFQKQKRSSLSEFIRISDDITFYRHYHGPLYFYSLIISDYFFGDLIGNNEYLSRWSSLLFLLAAIIVVYLGCLSLSQENATVAAVVASTALMSSSANILTAAQISVHSMYTVTSIITLFFMAKLLKTNDLKYWYWTIVAMAFSFTVVELAPLLLVTFIACVFFRRRNLFTNWPVRDYKKLFAYSVLLFIGVIFIVWPAAWLKLTLVKNYMFFTYLAVARGDELRTLRSRTFWEVWAQRLVSSPFTYALTIPLVSIALTKTKYYSFYLPFLLYSMLILIITFINPSPTPTYISSLLPPLYIINGLVLADLLKDSKKLLKIVLTAGLALVLVAHMWVYFIPYKSMEASYTPLKDLVNYMDGDYFDDKSFLVDRQLLPTLHYYFPNRHFDSYREGAGGAASIGKELRGSSYDGVLYEGKNHRDVEEALRQSVGSQPEIITLNKRITYYKITAGRP